MWAVLVFKLVREVHANTYKMDTTPYVQFCWMDQGDQSMTILNDNRLLPPAVTTSQKQTRSQILYYHHNIGK